jgi:hypothetical protein
MENVKCPSCGRPVRYKNAARGDGIYMVDAEPRNFIGENGRVLTGYREHKCPETIADPRINPGGARCTRKNTDNRKCHAFNFGECMNAFVCESP